LLIKRHNTTQWYSTAKCIPTNVFPNFSVDYISDELIKFSKVVAERTKKLSAQNNARGFKIRFSALIEFKNVKKTYRSIAATNSASASPQAAVVIPPPPPNSLISKRRRTSSSSSSSTAPSAAFFSPPPQSLVSLVPAIKPTLAFPIGPPPPDPNAAPPSKQRKRKTR
jgi:hypothetical protein